MTSPLTCRGLPPHDHEPTAMAFKARNVDKAVYECPECGAEGIFYTGAPARAEEVRE